MAFNNIYKLKLKHAHTHTHAHAHTHTQEFSNDRCLIVRLSPALPNPTTPMTVVDQTSIHQPAAEVGRIMWSVPLQTAGETQM